jgi:hypothetical protein
MKNPFLIVCFLVINLCWSQDHFDLQNRAKDSITFNPIKHKRIYEFRIPDFPFSVCVIENINGKLFGNINIHLNRYYNSEWKDFQGQFNLSKSTVKRIFKKLDDSKFEELEVPSIDEPCAIVLDGDFTIFKIITSTHKQNNYFTGITVNGNESRNCEKNILAQKIINFLNQELDFKVQFEEFRNQLPVGRYTYSSGITISEFYVN